MSPEQEKAIIERLKGEHAAAVRQGRLLRIELESIGKTLIVAGRQLIENPTAAEHVELSSAPNPFFDKINGFVTQLREAESEAKRLKGQLASLDVYVE